MKPVLQALLLADHIYEDRTTGKRIIAGIFNRLHGRRNKPDPPTAPAPSPGQSSPSQFSAGQPDPVRADQPPVGGPGQIAPGQSPVPPSAKEEPKAKKPLGGPEVGSPYVYISITEIYKSLLLQLKYVDLTDNTALITVDININVDKPNPLATIELTVPMPKKLPAPHAGTYALELWYENEVLGSHRVLVEIDG